MCAFKYRNPFVINNTKDKTPITTPQLLYDNPINMINLPVPFNRSLSHVLYFFGI